MKVLVATSNPGKLREYAELLADLDTGGLLVEWLSLADVGIDDEVDETGETMEENARLKAAAYSRLSSLLTLADDSGLEVDALGGAPGVHSARFSGPGANDIDRYQKLLDLLRDVPPGERGAQFRCVVALCAPEGEMHTAEGICRGQIAYEPRGTHGFGYDPVFYLPGLRMTLAEAGPEIKNRISHRARALAAIRPVLEALIRSQGKS
jgi:XTP/dITP diphosphohydrolase